MLHLFFDYLFEALTLSNHCNALADEEQFCEAGNICQ